jgi:hypothetical protein
MKGLLSSPAPFPQEQGEGKQAKEEGNFCDHVERLGFLQSGDKALNQCGGIVASIGG